MQGFPNKQTIEGLRKMYGGKKPDEKSNRMLDFGLDIFAKESDECL